MLLRILLFLFSITIGVVGGLFYVSYNKLDTIEKYNLKVQKENKDLVISNKKVEQDIDKTINKINITKNYEDYIKEYKAQIEKKKEEIKKETIQACKSKFIDGVNLALLKPSEDYLEFYFYKKILKFEPRINWYAKKNILYKTLGKYSYQNPYAPVKYYDVKNFLKYDLFFSSNKKYNNLLNVGFPFIGNINFFKYIKELKSYYIKKIDNTSNKIYVDGVLFYKLNTHDVKNSVTNILGRYLVEEKGFKEEELQEEGMHLFSKEKILNNKKIYINQEDLQKIYKNFLKANKNNLFLGNIIYSKDIEEEKEKCKSYGIDANKIFRENILKHKKEFAKFFNY